MASGKTAKKETAVSLLKNLILESENPFHIQKALHRVVSDYRNNSTDEDKEEVLKSVNLVVSFLDRLTESIKEFI